MATWNMCKEHHCKEPIATETGGKEKVLLRITSLPCCFLKVFHKQWFAHGFLWLVLLCLMSLLQLAVYNAVHCMGSTQQFFVLHVSFQHPLLFFKAQINLGWKSGKRRCCHSEVSKIYPCNRDRASPIVFLFFFSPQSWVQTFK